MQLHLDLRRERGYSFSIVKKALGVKETERNLTFSQVSKSAKKKKFLFSDYSRHLGDDDAGSARNQDFWPSTQEVYQTEDKYIQKELEDAGE